MNSWVSSMGRHHVGNFFRLLSKLIVLGNDWRLIPVTIDMKSQNIAAVYGLVSVPVLDIICEIPDKLAVAVERLYSWVTFS